MSKLRTGIGGLLCVSVFAAVGYAAAIPRPAPEFTINLPGGKTTSLSQYKGKTVALIFILTYCPHCQKIVSFLSQDQNEYGSRGFQVLASAIEDGAAGAVPGFIKKFSPPFPAGSNARPPVLDFLQHPMADRLLMPQLVFIDRHGMIRAQYAGDAPFLDEAQADKNLRSEIEELLKEGAPAAGKGAAKPAKK
ncbi:MAG TPA: TlpA disulfide reductase family protein [Bryobacteraceae bacterium]|nr:TlpA disulfide reductase family protein [Bryobacteraceae bacterium]